MPSWLRNDIQGFLYDVATFFRQISYRFEDAADWAADIPGIGYYIAYALYKVQDYCYDANYLFKDLMWGWLDLCDWLDNLWDDLGYLWDDLDTLWDYVHYTLRYLVNDAVALANDAWDKAALAYNLAIDALTEIPAWILTKLADAYDAAIAIAGVIGTTLDQIVQFVKDNAEIIYQTINEYITNVYNTFKEYITNVYETINHIYNTYVTNIIGVTEGIVLDLIAAALAPFIAAINLINLWFNDIQDFFNAPLDWLWGRFTDWFLGPEK